MGLTGKLETEIEINAPADKFYKIFKGQAHHVPNISPTYIQNVNVHEGDWETHGSIKSWSYTIGDEVSIFKEKVEYDDENRAVTFVGIEGEMFKFCKKFIATCKYTPKGDDKTVAHLSIEYEKISEDMPPPSKYIDFMVGVNKDIEAHLLKT